MNSFIVFFPWDSGWDQKLNLPERVENYKNILDLDMYESIIRSYCNKLKKKISHKKKLEQIVFSFNFLISFECHTLEFLIYTMVWS